MIRCIGYSAALRALPLSGSLNKRICGSALLRPNSLSQTSHIPRTLSEIVEFRHAKYSKNLNMNR